VSSVSVSGSGFPAHPTLDTPLRLQTSTDKPWGGGTSRISTDANGGFTRDEAIGSPTFLGSITWFARVFDDANDNFAFDQGEQLLASGHSGTVTCTPPAVDEPPAFPALSNVEVNATSPSGAAVTYTVSATDKEDGSIAGNCVPPSASTFPIGTTTVTCTATDLGGHTVSAMFDVVVKGATGQITDLSKKVSTINLNQGIANSLDAKLHAVQDALASVKDGKTGAACNKLDAALNEISAQSGKDITVAQADALIADINRIKAVIGCA
jgi:hypothetical protein